MHRDHHIALVIIITRGDSVIFSQSQLFHGDRLTPRTAVFKPAAK